MQSVGFYYALNKVKMIKFNNSTETELVLWDIILDIQIYIYIYYICYLHFNIYSANIFGCALPAQWGPEGNIVILTFALFS
jgi:hypothetical protein